jgi:Tfp pilus assembly protein PilX
MEYIYRSARTQQRGIVLVAALLFLFVLTLLGMSIFESSALQHKMSQNYVNKALAFANAESVLTKAKLNLLQNNPETFSNTDCHISSYEKDFCINKICYLLAATGTAGKAKAVVYGLYEVQSSPQPDETTGHKIDLLCWWES